MDPMEQLRRARGEFERRVALVRPEHLGLPTPCPAWDVSALLRHVVGADRAYLALLSGASAEEFGRVDGECSLGNRPADDFATSSRALLEVFAEPGALERTVHHPVGDIPGLRLLGMRVTDWTIHGWDLARAIGADESMDGVLAETLLARVLARGPALYSTGYFQRGPGVPETAAAQDRLLDVLGRKPTATAVR
jgi:uncharacterized protein (TIGR03086 family)